MATHFDSDSFIRIAENIVASNGFNASENHPYCYEIYWTPDCPYFLSVHFRLFKDGIKEARFIQSLTSILFCLMVYILTKDLFGTQSGLWAAFLFALYPFEFHYFGITLAKELSAFFLTASI